MTRRDSKTKTFFKRGANFIAALSKFHELLGENGEKTQKGLFKSLHTHEQVVLLKADLRISCGVSRCPFPPLPFCNRRFDLLRLSLRSERNGRSSPSPIGLRRAPAAALQSLRRDHVGGAGFIFLTIIVSPPSFFSLSLSFAFFLTRLFFSPPFCPCLPILIGTPLTSAPGPRRGRRGRADEFGEI